MASLKRLQADVILTSDRNDQSIAQTFIDSLVSHLRHCFCYPERVSASAVMANDLPCQPSACVHFAAGEQKSDEI